MCLIDIFIFAIFPLYNPLPAEYRLCHLPAFILHIHHIYHKETLELISLEGFHHLRDMFLGASHDPIEWVKLLANIIQTLLFCYSKYDLNILFCIVFREIYNICILVWFGRFWDTCCPL